MFRRKQSDILPPIKMDITEIFIAPDRATWRVWLQDNHATTPEIWLLYAKKSSNKPSVSYSDAVEEALCFGWIDGLSKKYDADYSAQRFTPRRKRSNWSELNKERCRRLIAQGLITPAGYAVLPDLTETPVIIPPDIEAALKETPPAWDNFAAFPELYQRIRIGAMEEVRKSNPVVFQQRLAYFVKMTAQNRTYGTIQGKDEG